MPDHDDPVQDEDKAETSHHLHDVVTPLTSRRNQQEQPTEKDVRRHPSVPKDSVDEATLRTVRDRLKKASSGSDPDPDIDPDPDMPRAS